MIGKPRVTVLGGTAKVYIAGKAYGVEVSPSAMFDGSLMAKVVERIYTDAAFRADLDRKRLIPLTPKLELL